MISRELSGQVSRYAGATLVSAVFSLGLPLLLHEWLDLPERLAVAVALVASFLVNFVSVRSIVFARSGGVGSDFAKFLLVSLTARGAEYALFLALFDLAGLQYLLALAIALIVSICVKFPIYKFWIFSR